MGASAMTAKTEMLSVRPLEPADEQKVVDLYCLRDPESHPYDMFWFLWHHTHSFVVEDKNHNIVAAAIAGSENSLLTTPIGLINLLVTKAEPHQSLCIDLLIKALALHCLDKEQEELNIFVVDDDPVAFAALGPYAKDAVLEHTGKIKRRDGEVVPYELWTLKNLRRNFLHRSATPPAPAP